MSLFRKKKESTELMPVTTRPLTERDMELATIKVPDIKKYLVDEYKRSEEMEKKIQELEGLLRMCKETEFKYEASLVTIDEFKGRLNRKEKAIEDLKQQLYKKEDELAAAYDEVNTYRIKMSRAAIDKDEIRREVVDETKSKIVERFNQHKGSLSKKKAIELVLENEVLDDK